MDNILNFPIDIHYQTYGIHRDGRIIVQLINSSKRVIMDADDIIANPSLIGGFSKKQVQWLCDIAEINNRNLKEQII